MAVSTRSLQMSMNAAGFSLPEMQALFDTQLFVLQNYLATTTANATTTTLGDAVVSGGASGIDIAGNALQVELQENLNLTTNNIWIIEAHFSITTTAAAGIKFQVTAYDGLQIFAASDFTNWINWTVNCNAGATAPTSLTSAGTTTPGNAISVQNANATPVSVDLFGMLRVNGYGRLGIQFAQGVASGNTSLPNGYLAAYTLLP